MSSKKSAARRAAYKAKQEKEGKNVVKWIFGVLVALAIIFIIASFIIFS